MILDLGELLSNTWKKSGFLVVFTKSGISTSFWRGLHFLRSQGPNPDFRRSGWSHGARRPQRPIFQDFSTLSTSKISKTRSPTGAPGDDWPSLGSQLSNTWKKTCFLISSLILGSSTGRILSVLTWSAICSRVPPRSLTHISTDFTGRALFVGDAYVLITL